MLNGFDLGNKAADFELKEKELAKLTLGDALRVRTSADKLAKVRKALRDLEQEGAGRSVEQQLASNPRHKALAREHHRLIEEVRSFIEIRSPSQS